MKHFAAVDWIDFVNHVAHPHSEMAMQKHLAEGCESCAAELERWKRIQQVAGRESRYQPPRELVHMAKAAFSGSAWARDRKDAKGTIELLFDSFRQPLLAGVRATTSAPRRMLYLVDRLEIDLQVESQAEGRTIVVTGQLLDLRHPAAVRDLRVTLSNLRGRTVETSTNEFGEFREEIEDSGDLQLMLPGGSGEPFVITLPDVLGRTGGKST
jgi:hypothetical protein